ncbi:MAG: sodium:proton antiporter [Bdellovibrionales bacterium]|nr:sodium:proton antiporter [Bdellovibrionales bacterium]
MTQEHILISITAILALGTIGQWIAWRFQLPSIFILLITGLIVGPICGFLNPDEIFGPILFPLVSLSVSVILFEGALTLKFSQIRHIAGSVRNLATIGVLVAWALTSICAAYILDFDLYLSLLIGALLVVTGPTVIIPLLRHIRPRGQVGTVLRWEGIVTDPIGAILAILVFEAIYADKLHELPIESAIGVLKTLLVSVLVGLPCAVILIRLIRYHLVPDFLESMLGITIVVFAFTVSNHFVPESGLLTVTMLGVILANQNKVPVRDIEEFSKNLRVLLIASLFIILSARLDTDYLRQIRLESLLFLAALILIVRPASVLVATAKSQLSKSEKIMLCLVAPRGIVAAAISSVIGLKLVEIGYPQGEAFAPVVFLVVLGTVTFYGLVAGPLANLLGLSQRSSPGILIAGANIVAREIGKALQSVGCKVLLVDTNVYKVELALTQGVDALVDDILDLDDASAVGLDQFSTLLALTANPNVNNLAGYHYAGIFGRSEIFAIQVGNESQLGRSINISLNRALFCAKCTFELIEEQLRKGNQIQILEIAEDTELERLREEFGESLIPFFTISKGSKLSFFGKETSPSLSTGDKLAYLPLG